MPEPHSDQTPTGTNLIRAGLAELELLVPLFDGYRQFYGQESDLQGAHAFLMARLERDESVVFLALSSEETTGTAAGFVQLYPLFTSSGMKRVWILNDLFVSPNHRRRGIARLLMMAARSFAESTGAAQIRLATHQDNAAAKALYEELGYRVNESYDSYVLGI